jgi:hypothetical protein
MNPATLAARFRREALARSARQRARPVRGQRVAPSYRRPPPPPPSGWCRRISDGVRVPCTMRPEGLHGADDVLGSITEPVMLYGMIPMGIAVVAGLWMALH